MSLRIEDDLLIAVLEGRASADVEKKVELAIQSEPKVRHIETEHPSTPSDPRRDRKSSVHHFVPELPEAWRDGKLLPGVYPDFTHHRATRPL